MQSEGLQIAKIKTANNYSMALMSFYFANDFFNLRYFRGWKTFCLGKQ